MLVTYRTTKVYSNEVEIERYGLCIHFLKQVILSITSIYLNLKYTNIQLKCNLVGFFSNLCYSVFLFCDLYIIKRWKVLQ